MIFFQKYKKIILLICILLLTFFLYSPVLNADFVWDDKIFFFEQDTYTQGVWSWEAVSRSVLPHASYFRPLVFSTYIYEIKFFGLNPTIFHITNLLIHLANIILAYHLARILLAKINITYSSYKALLIALVYAIHPTQIETVAWIAGRFDLLAAFFSFISLILFIQYKNNKAFITLGLFTWFCALLSKDSAVLILPIVFFLFSALDDNKNWLISVKHTILENKFLLLGMISVFLIYYVLRVEALPHALIVNNQLNYLLDYKPLNRVILVLYLITEYTLHAIFPFFNIGPIHPFDQNTIHTTKWYIYPFISIIMLLAVVYGLYNKNKFSIFFTLFFICLSLVIQIIPIFSGGTIQDRFLYFPLFFLLISLATLNYNLVKLQEKFFKYTIICLWLILSIWSLFVTVPLWKNNLTLWGWQYIKFPESYAREHYFKELLSLNRLDILEKEFSKIMKSKKYKEQGFELSTQLFYGTYLIQKHDSEAIPYLRGVLVAYPTNKFGLPIYKDTQMNRSFIEVNVQLAQAYFLIKDDKKQAIAILKIVQKVDPNHPNVRELEKMLTE
ncbi:hypothetical protein [Acinetobacter variabilis]|uniref:hypothetical protein n=1 Tax=Acinetobacter variabilis TaxID=70346 RepID=UPI0028D3653C|nr:hypothetical protein [Acinetobacter lwoffii]